MVTQTRLLVLNLAGACGRASLRPANSAADGRSTAGTCDTRDRVHASSASPQLDWSVGDAHNLIPPRPATFEVDMKLAVLGSMRARTRRAWQQRPPGNSWSRPYRAITGWIANLTSTQLGLATTHASSVNT